MTNNFGANASVGTWSGAKSNDVWFITIRWGTPNGTVTGARGAKAVGEQLGDTKEITAHPGQSFTVFATAWLAFGSGLTVSAQKQITMQARCATTTTTTSAPPRLFTVIFAEDGGTGSMSPQSASAPTALTPNGFVRAGFHFVRWSTSLNGVGTFYADTEIYSFASDLTLVAQWQANA